MNVRSMRPATAGPRDRSSFGGTGNVSRSRPRTSRPSYGGRAGGGISDHSTFGRPFTARATMENTDRYARTTGITPGGLSVEALTAQKRTRPLSAAATPERASLHRTKSKKVKPKPKPSAAKGNMKHVREGRAANFRWQERDGIDLLIRGTQTFDKIPTPRAGMSAVISSPTKGTRLRQIDVSSTLKPTIDAVRQSIPMSATEVARPPVKNLRYTKDGRPKTAGPGPRATFATSRTPSARQKGKLAGKKAAMSPRPATASPRSTKLMQKFGADRENNSSSTNAATPAQSHSFAHRHGITHSTPASLGDTYGTPGVISTGGYPETLLPDSDDTPLHALVGTDVSPISSTPGEHGVTASTRTTVAIDMPGVPGHLDESHESSPRKPSQIDASGTAAEPERADIHKPSQEDLEYMAAIHGDPHALSGSVDVGGDDGLDLSAVPRVASEAGPRRDPLEASTPLEVEVASAKPILSTSDMFDPDVSMPPPPARVDISDDNNSLIQSVPALANASTASVDSVISTNAATARVHAMLHAGTPSRGSGDGSVPKLDFSDIFQDREFFSGQTSMAALASSLPQGQSRLSKSARTRSEHKLRAHAQASLSQAYAKSFAILLADKVPAPKLTKAVDLLLSNRKPYVPTRPNAQAYIIDDRTGRSDTTTPRRPSSARSAYRTPRSAARSSLSSSRLRSERVMSAKGPRTSFRPSTFSSNAAWPGALGDEPSPADPAPRRKRRSRANGRRIHDVMDDEGITGTATGTHIDAYASALGDSSDSDDIDLDDSLGVHPVHTRPKYNAGVRFALEPPSDGPPEVVIPSRKDETEPDHYAGIAF